MASLMGVDFGRKRTGIALAEWEATGNEGGELCFPTQLNIANIVIPKEVAAIRYYPLATISKNLRSPLIQAIHQHLQQWQPICVVIGSLPKRDDGEVRQITLMARKLARQIHAQLAIPTVLFDESLTSFIADQGNDISGIIPIDQAAAIELLRGFIAHNSKSRLTSFL